MVAEDLQFSDLGVMEMEEHYQFGRTELEAIVKNNNHFLSPPAPPPPLPPEMVAHNPFRFTGFFQAGLLGRQHQHHSTMVNMGVGDQEEVGTGGTHQELESGLLYPVLRPEFCSTDDLSVSIAANAAHLHGVMADGDPILGVHGATGSTTATDYNLKRCRSSSPSGKIEEMQGGGDGGCSRWPRHETLTLLELRAQLDYKFREATQKGPLWEELAREMAEGYGYHRSGKKCREKFENLYKYYKKTKEGRTGRQDGKSYRFYAQLEALCGGGDGEGKNSKLANATSNLNSGAHGEFDLEVLKSGGPADDRKKCINVSLEKIFDSPELDVLSMSSGQSPEEGPLAEADQKREKAEEELGKNWRRDIKSCMEKQVQRFVDRQEEWFDRILKTLERQEEGRLAREEAWRKEERERLQKEHEFWAKEREWAEARDAKIMEFLRKMVAGEECTTTQSILPNPAHFHTQEGELNHMETTARSDSPISARFRFS